MGYDLKEFYDGLVQHGLIVPVGVPGAFGRGALFEEVLERFNALVSELARADGAESYTFPPVISRAVLERVKYLESFPHLCGAVYSFFGDEERAKTLAARAGAGEPWAEFLGMTDVVMNPAACYPVYPSFTGTLPENGRLQVEVRGELAAILRLSGCANEETPAKSPEFLAEQIKMVAGARNLRELTLNCPI